MTSYFIKSILCSGILLVFYYLFLEQEKMFRFNRFYLLASILFSLIVPLISIELDSDIVVESIPIFTSTENLSGSIPVRFEKVVAETNFNWSEFLPIGIYTVIAMILLMRLIRNLISIFVKRKNQLTISYQDARLVLLDEDTITYTFLGHIFVNKTDFHKNQIETEVLTHELAHVRQKHSLDVLFIEFIHALFWINPLFGLYKKAIQTNHEFLADEAVLLAYSNTKDYQLLLLEKLTSQRHINLTSSFNYSITKKRLAMMTKMMNPTRQIVKQGCVMILTVCLVCIFSEKIYSQIKSEAPVTKSSESKTSSSKGNPAKKSGAGITDKMMEEFNSLVKQYAKIKKTSKGTDYQDFHETPITIKKQLYATYLKMNPQQQGETKVAFFESPIPSKVAPTPELFEAWKNPKTFGIWIDGKHVTNKELDKYKNTDIAESSISKLYGRAKRGVIYKYQLDLTTNGEFDRTYQARVNDRIMIGSKWFLQD